MVKVTIVVATMLVRFRKRFKRKSPYSLDLRRTTVTAPILTGLSPSDKLH